MKKNWLYILPCSLFLLATACSDPSPASLREAQNNAVLLPPKSVENMTASTPESAAEAVLDSDSVAEEAEMRTFLDRVWNREPASITLTAVPEERGGPSRSRIIYDGVAFTVAEFHGKTSDCCYYTDLDTTTTPHGTTIYLLTGLGFFEGRSLSGPGFFPEIRYLAELSPMEGEPPAPPPAEPDDLELTGPYPPETAAQNGDYVNCHGILYNACVMEQFLTRAAAHEEASIRTVWYTAEGNPVLTDVVFDGSVFTVTKDTTQDTFGPQEHFTNQYTRLELVYVPELDITEYRFTGLGMGDRPLDYIVLKYDLGNTTAP